MLSERLFIWSAGYQVNGTTVNWAGGITAFTCTSSNFNSATVTLNWIAPDGTVLAVGTSTTVTQNAFVLNLALPAGQYSAAVSGGTPTALSVVLDRMPQ